MNYLDHLADEIRKAGGKTMPWQSLRNVHFRGDDPIGQVEAWAQKERLRASFDYQEESPTQRVVGHVTFSPLNPTI
jgi:hypothetical protein